jgi:hypothetical protein
MRCTILLGGVREEEATEEDLVCKNADVVEYECKNDM